MVVLLGMHLVPRSAAGMPAVQRCCMSHGELSSVPLVTGLMDVGGTWPPQSRVVCVCRHKQKWHQGATLARSFLHAHSI